jgi:hypothetical protein
MPGPRRRLVSIAVLDGSDTGVALVAALAGDDRVMARLVVPRAGAEVALGELLAWRTDIVLLDADTPLGTGWAPEQLVAPLLACGTEVVVRGGGEPAASDRRLAVERRATVPELVDAVRSLYPELRGRPGPPAPGGR